VSAFGNGSSRAGTDHLGDYLGFALIWSQEVDCSIVSAFGTLNINAGHGGIEDVGEVGVVLLGACVRSVVPACSSLL
jgi:hypothetical protein